MQFSRFVKKWLSTRQIAPIYNTYNIPAKWSASQIPKRAPLQRSSHLQESTCNVQNHLQESGFAGPLSTLLHADYRHISRGHVVSCTSNLHAAHEHTQSRRRHGRIHVKASVDEYSQIAACATRTSLSKASNVRKCTLNQPFQKRATKELQCTELKLDRQLQTLEKRPRQH